MADMGHDHDHDHDHDEHDHEGDPGDADMRAALAQELLRMRPRDLLAQTAVMLANQAAIRMGLAGPEHVDREQAREAIDALGGVVDLLAPIVPPEELEALRSDLAQLRMAFVQSQGAAQRRRRSAPAARPSRPPTTARTRSARRSGRPGASARSPRRGPPVPSRVDARVTACEDPADSTPGRAHGCGAAELVRRGRRVCAREPWGSSRASSSGGIDGAGLQPRPACSAPSRSSPAMGVHAPAILLISFIPMLFIATAFYYLNKADPDCGTTFSWCTRAFGPWVGWIAGWAVLAADIIVMANLADIAGLYSWILVGQDAPSKLGRDDGRGRAG